MTESESANWNFPMYRHNEPRPRSSYTKYYRILVISRVEVTTSFLFVLGGVIISCPM